MFHVPKAVPHLEDAFLLHFPFEVFNNNPVDQFYVTQKLPPVSKSTLMLSKSMLKVRHGLDIRNMALQNGHMSNPCRTLILDFIEF